MPIWLRRYFFRHSLHFHFGVSFVCGLLFRCLSAYFVYGPQALDDFNHSVTPAYFWLTNQAMQVPLYRSNLLIWMLSLFMRVGQHMGFATPLGELRSCYFFLGILSLTGLVGTYLFVRNYSSRIFGPVALYLIAIFPLMPFVSTRALGESVASGFVLLGFGILEDLRHRSESRLLPYVVGFSMLGIATLFRFQVGLLYVAYLLVLAVQFRFAAVKGGLAAGVLTWLGAGVIDLLSGKNFLETLGLYLLENANGGQSFGIDPWYNTWLLFLALGLFPFTLIFWRSFPSLWKRHWSWLVPVLLFVASHSAIAHKEERFLYPILGLELWAVAWLWSTGARLRSARRIFTPLIFFALGPLLLLVSTINTQEGSIAPQARASSTYRGAIIIYYEAQEGLFHFKNFFVRPPMQSTLFSGAKISHNDVDQYLADNPGSGAAVIVTSDASKAEELKILARTLSSVSRCLEPIRFGSWSDRLLFAANPNHNQRRRPSWYLSCERLARS